MRKKELIIGISSIVIFTALVFAIPHIRSTTNDLTINNILDFLALGSMIYMFFGISCLQEVKNSIDNKRRENDHG